MVLIKHQKFLYRLFVTIYKFNDYTTQSDSAFKCISVRNMMCYQRIKVLKNGIIAFGERGLPLNVFQLLCINFFHCIIEIINCMNFIVLLH